MDGAAILEMLSILAQISKAQTRNGGWFLGFLNAGNICHIDDEVFYPYLKDIPDNFIFKLETPDNAFINLVVFCGYPDLQTSELCVIHVSCYMIDS